MSNGGRRYRLDISDDPEFLWTIGAVAQAIGRSSETVRRAHTDGRLPRPTATLQLEDGRKVRLYSKPYIELAPAVFAANRRH